MKRAFYEHPLGMKDVLRKKKIISKRVVGELFYAVTKKIFKAEKALVTPIHRVNLKMLCAALLLLCSIN
jgi:IS5 family transposase